MEAAQHRFVGAAASASVGMLAARTYLAENSAGPGESRRDRLSQQGCPANEDGRRLPLAAVAGRNPHRRHRVQGYFDDRCDT